MSKIFCNPYSKVLAIKPLTWKQKLSIKLKKLAFWTKT
jgi:hypothetical protein